MADQADLNRRFRTARATERDGRAALVRALDAYVSLLPEVRGKGRGQLRRSIWEVERALGRRPRHHSQAGQDAYLDEQVFGGLSGGTFVEVGAYDGITGSNTLFFELHRGWSGLLIEPSPTHAAQARAARKAPCAECAAGRAAGEAEFLEVRAGLSQMGGLVGSYDPALRAQVEADPRHEGEVIRVPVRPLADILAEHGIERADYVSLDVEGGEMAVLETFPFGRIEVAAWTVENNSGGGEIAEFMSAKGYRRAEMLGVDEVYVRSGDQSAHRSR